MPIRVDAVELIDLLTLTPPSQNLMLVGRHGIGKSEILTDHFGRQGIRVIAFFLGQMSDPGDLIGLLHKDESSGRSEFLPPYWWPEDERPIVLFLDELNRARPEILQSVMELALNKTLAGKTLPAGSRIVAAVNDGDEYQLTDLDPALVSRFNLYEFSPTVDDWLTWAVAKRIDSRVRSFVRSNPHFLDGNVDSANQPDAFVSTLDKSPDRRGWARVSEMIGSIKTLDDLHVKLIAGIVGPTAANAFRRFVASPPKIDVATLLLQFDSKETQATLSKMGLADLTSLNDQIVTWIASEHCSADRIDDALNGLHAYLTSLRNRKLDEAVAHFVSLVMSPSHSDLMSLVARSVPLTTMLTDYVEAIRVE